MIDESDDSGRHLHAELSDDLTVTHHRFVVTDRQLDYIATAGRVVLRARRRPTTSFDGNLVKAEVFVVA